MSVHWATVATGIGIAAFMGAVTGLVPAWQAAPPQDRRRAAARGVGGATMAIPISYNVRNVLQPPVVHARHRGRHRPRGRDPRAGAARSPNGFQQSLVATGSPAQRARHAHRRRQRDLERHRAEAARHPARPADVATGAGRPAAGEPRTWSCSSTRSAPAARARRTSPSAASTARAGPARPGEDRRRAHVRARRGRGDRRHAHRRAASRLRARRPGALRPARLHGGRASSRPAAPRSSPRSGATSAMLMPVARAAATSRASPSA